MFRKGLILLLLGLMLLPWASVAEPPKETLEQIREELRQRQKAAKEKEKEERELSLRLQHVSARVGDLEGKMRALEEAYKDLEGQIQALSKEILQTEDKIEKVQGRLRQRIVSLLEIQRGALGEVLLSSESYGELLIRMKVLHIVLQRDREMLSELARLLQERRDRLEKLKDTQGQLAKKAYELQSMKKELVDKKGEVERLLSKVREEKQKELERIAYLERRKRALEELVKSLSSPTPSKLPTLVKGFPLPAEGTLKTLAHYEGIAIYCQEGTEVRAVGSGRVAFASWFEGYGNLVIIDHGRGYHTVYAHLGKILKGQGEEVKAREVIGLAGSEGMIYFEVRKNGRCEPPNKWLALPIAEGGKR